jgi:pimeloyl-ACP methyl ester carboxylesterase
MDTPTTTHLPVASQQNALDDWRALGDLVQLTTERLTAPVQGTHEAITDRLFALAGRAGSAEHAAHRVFTRTVYGSVRIVGSVVGASMDIGTRAIGRHTRVRPPWGPSVGAAIKAAANALWGDEFERRASPVHTHLAIRDSSGSPVANDSDGLVQAFPAPTPRLAVMLHGLGKTERSWDGSVDDSGEFVGLPDALEADGFTPVLVRYNTGRQVADNGAALACLLEEVTENWPVPVDEVALIGHSMGGLIARSSLHAGESFGHRWTHIVRHLVGLCTPHLGSPIEKGVEVASVILATTSVSRPLGQFVDGRSAGIKDMRHGTIGAAATSERSTADTGPADEVCHHHAVGVVTSKTSHPLGYVVGDLVVRVDSASGAGGRVQPTNLRVFGGLNHLGMLHDSAVHSQIRDWLTPLHEPSVTPS